MAVDNLDRFVWNPEDIEIISEGKPDEQTFLDKMSQVASRDEAINILPEIEQYLESINDVLELSRAKQEAERIRMLAAA